MKRFKLVFAALGVFAIVSSALAFKPAVFTAPDVKICSAATNFICQLPQDVNLSTVSGSNPHQLPQVHPYYKGTGSCQGTNPPCVKIAPLATVFDNQ